MSNNGKLEQFTSLFSSFKFAEGKTFKRAIFSTSQSKIILSIKNDEPNIIDLKHTFKPEDRKMVDYFLKV